MAITQAMFDKSPNYLGGTRKINFFELKYTIGFNNTDFRIYPLNGIDAKITILKRGLGIDKDVNQFNIRTECSFYQKITSKISTSFVFRGRLAFPQEQPYYFNTGLGYKNEYLRGYEYYVIDGSHYGLLRLNLRHKIIDRVIHQHILPIFKYIPISFYAKAYNDSMANFIAFAPISRSVSGDVFSTFNWPTPIIYTPGFSK